MNQHIHTILITINYTVSFVEKEKIEIHQKVSKHCNCANGVSKHCNCAYGFVTIANPSGIF